MSVKEKSNRSKIDWRLLRKKENDGLSIVQTEIRWSWSFEDVHMANEPSKREFSLMVERAEFARLSVRATTVLLAGPSLLLWLPCNWHVRISDAARPMENTRSSLAVRVFLLLLPESWKVFVLRWLSRVSRFAALAEIRAVSLLLSKRFTGGNNSRAERDSAVKSICVFSCCFPYSYALCAILYICGDAAPRSKCFVDFC